MNKLYSLKQKTNTPEQCLFPFGRRFIQNNNVNYLEYFSPMIENI